MGESGVLGHRDGDDVSPGIGRRLSNGVHDLLGFPDPNPNLPILIPNNDDSPKRELFPTLDDLGDPPNLHDPLLEPIIRLLLLAPAEESTGGLLQVRVHDIDVVSKDTDAAVRWSVDLLIGGGDILLGLWGKLVEGGRWDISLRRCRRIKRNVSIGIEVVEEAGVDVLVVPRSDGMREGEQLGGTEQGDKSRALENPRFERKGAAERKGGEGAESSDGRSGRHYRPFRASEGLISLSCFFSYITLYNYVIL